MITKTPEGELLIGIPKTQAVLDEAKRRGWEVVGMKKKKVTILLELSGDDADHVAEHSGGVDLTQLLRDSLGEFQDQRQPTHEYVGKRYPHATEAGRKFKQREVEKRCLMAKVVSRSIVSILIEENEGGSK